MKIPFRAIAILIITSLIGVFAYQGYWLVGLYQSMKKDMDNCLMETLQLSDYNELMARIRQALDQVTFEEFRSQYSGLLDRPAQETE